MSSTPRQRGARLQHAATDQYSGGAAPRTERVSRSIVAATVAGNAMEFYDFTTYAFFAIGRAWSRAPAWTQRGSLPTGLRPPLSYDDYVRAGRCPSSPCGS